MNEVKNILGAGRETWDAAQSKVVRPCDMLFTLLLPRFPVVTHARYPDWDMSQSGAIFQNASAWGPSHLTGTIRIYNLVTVLIFHFGKNT